MQRKGCNFIAKISPSVLQSRNIFPFAPFPTVVCKVQKTFLYADVFMRRVRLPVSRCSSVCLVSPGSRGPRRLCAPHSRIDLDGPFCGASYETQKKISRVSVFLHKARGLKSKNVFSCTQFQRFLGVSTTLLPHILGTYSRFCFIFLGFLKMRGKR